jgi:hypothetical protein
MKKFDRDGQNSKKKRAAVAGRGLTTKIFTTKILTTKDTKVHEGNAYKFSSSSYSASFGVKIGISTSKGSTGEAAWRASPLHNALL